MHSDSQPRVRTLLGIAPRRSIVVLLAAAAAVAMMLVQPMAAGAQTADLIEGDLPTDGGFALVRVTAAASADDVADALDAQGCAPVSIAITSGGSFLVYVPGAPAFVNADFPSSLTANQPFAVRCGSPSASAEPTVQDAVDTLVDYFEAINGGDYETAYHKWGDNGANSGQTLAQFQAGYADTASVTVDIGEPSRVDAAAGSRYIDIPVDITATLTDGATQHFTGTYALRRAVVDGATAAQRAWSIYSADVAEVD